MKNTGPNTSPLSVPYAALGLQAKEIKAELLSAIEAVIESGHYILGPNVQMFEREFAVYCGTQFSLGVSNGTAALQLVFRAMGIGEGDEVITAPNSFIASASSVALVGARPVFADIGDDLNLDPKSVEAAITPHTKAILAVHLTGRPARMPEILALAKQRGLRVIEDAAQSVGARLDNRAVGSWGYAACFSLHPLKNLHAMGDGGMITTDDKGLYERLLKGRNHGLKNRDECEFWSDNARLDEMQAAILRIQLKYLPQRTEERRRLAFRYNDALRPYVVVPEESKGEHCVYQTYMVQAERRDALQQALNDQGVQAAVHYALPIHLQPAAKSLGYTQRDFPRAVKAASRILSLPLYPGLTQAQQEQVVKVIADFYKGRS